MTIRDLRTGEDAWKPPQEWRVRVARFYGEIREFRHYIRPTREEALALAEDLDRTGAWDSIWIEQRDIFKAPRKLARKPVDSPRANRNRKRKAVRKSAAERTLDMFAIDPKGHSGECLP